MDLLIQGLVMGIVQGLTDDPLRELGGQAAEV